MGEDIFPVTRGRVEFAGEPLGFVPGRVIVGQGAVQAGIGAEPVLDPLQAGPPADGRARGFRVVRDWKTISIRHIVEFGDQPLGD